MGWLFGGNKHKSHTESLHPAWEYCSSCPRLSRAGAPGGVVNCVLSADEKYLDVRDYYDDHYDNVEYSYAVVDFYFYANYTTYVCCGQKAHKGTRVGRITHSGERRHGRHHVLVVSVQTGRSFFGKVSWRHVVYDSNDDGDGIGFDTLSQVKDYLRSSYAEMADSRIDVSIEDFTGRGRLRRFFAAIAEEFED